MERKELLVTDMQTAFGGNKNISTELCTTKWFADTYEHSEYSGTFITSIKTDSPCELTFDPKLTGYYRISVGFPGRARSSVTIKLSDDKYPATLSTLNSWDAEEMMFKCADMTGQSIIISGKSTICSLRFVQLTDEEAEEVKYDRIRTDTKKFYASEYVGDNMDFYEGSDTEWIAPECGVELGKTEEELNRMRHYYQMAHDVGIKVSHTIRLGYWGGSFPHALKPSPIKFAAEHPDMHCVDRDGQELYYMSFAYPEVRKQRIDIAMEALKTGGEAVTVMICRGVPFVAFEKPVCDAFYEKYGEYPYDRPMDDPDLNAIHCEFMTMLFRELREAIDKEYGKDNNIEIHLRGMNSIDDCKYLGVDPVMLAKEGLIQRVITHQRRFLEELFDEVLKSKDPPRVDLEKFSEFTRKGGNSTVLLWNEGDLFAPYRNSRGELYGPRNFEENVKQWEAFGKEYSIPIYHELSAYCRDPHTLWKTVNRVNEAGGERFSIFNTSCCAGERNLFHLVRRICHKNDKWASADPNLKAYRVYRVRYIGKCYYNRYEPIWGG